LMSKTFDNGTVCASEQAIVVKESCAQDVIAAFEEQGGYFLSPEEIDKVGQIAFDAERGIMAASIVGQSVEQIANKAGIQVPADTQVLLARLQGVGREHPLSAEILAPILAFYVEKEFDQSIERCTEITQYGGRGHTAVIYSNTEERIEYFSSVINAGRILVNMPSTHGALGGMMNTLSPSFTLACGTSGKNNTTDNITARHLLNIHRITRRRPNPFWHRFDSSKYFDENLSGADLEREYYKNT
ncbi:bifunctional acetaldehyde-CoA/alcohol dehydrogenase, partial [Oligoflexia bacterium]|nr:bifunctional acetaldehyde-CoA/alcohol dehydrogenase [Oligoflexia bacterium]